MAIEGSKTVNIIIKDRTDRESAHREYFEVCDHFDHKPQKAGVCHVKPPKNKSGSLNRLCSLIEILKKGKGTRFQI